MRHEWTLLASIVTTVSFLIFGGSWLADLSHPVWFTFILIWLFGVILLSAFRIVHHAESLAVILGEPVGTLVLTLSVIGIEVMMISAVMLTGDGKPALARDTMFAVVMILLNGMAGVSLLLGGLRHHEQTYNLQGANAFLALIVPLAVLGLVLPSYTTTTPGPTLSPFQSIFSSVMSIGIYGIFLGVQTSRHREYFVAPDVDEAVAGNEAAQQHHHDDGEHIIKSVPHHALLLVMYILPLVVLAKQLAVPLEYGTRVLGAPQAVSGLLVAILILSPEAMSAVRAAVRNELQRSVNIILGSVLATIGLTIPAVLIISLITGKTVFLGLSTVDTILLLLTLALSTLTFSNNRTNVLLGAVHLLLFLAYIMFIFEH
ncbi:MAG: calcium:proton antiporter [Acidobacteriota bacterium]|nr:calcium:proton antiporter [Acidobacteriota bacterium]